MKQPFFGKVFLFQSMLNRNWSKRLNYETIRLVLPIFQQLCIKSFDSVALSRFFFLILFQVFQEACKPEIEHLQRKSKYNYCAQVSAKFCQLVLVNLTTAIFFQYFQIVKKKIMLLKIFFSNKKIVTKIA